MKRFWLTLPILWVFCFNPANVSAKEAKQIVSPHGNIVLFPNPKREFGGKGSIEETAANLTDKKGDHYQLLFKWISNGGSGVFLNVKFEPDKSVEITKWRRTAKFLGTFGWAPTNTPCPSNDGKDPYFYEKNKERWYTGHRYNVSDFNNDGADDLMLILFKNRCEEPKGLESKAYLFLDSEDGYQVQAIPLDQFITSREKFESKNLTREQRGKFESYFGTESHFTDGYIQQ